MNVEEIFPNSDISGPPLFYAINRGGPYGLDTRSPVWKTAKDPLYPDCLLCLCRFVDGSPIVLRYRKRDIKGVF